MGFWIYMLVMTLLIPAIMICFGRFFSRKAPDRINHGFGYRTARSMKNKDTWVFAHKCVGKLWTRLGWTLLPLSVLVMLPVFGKDKDTVGYTGAALEALQILVMIGTIFFVEKELKKTFDNEGRRRNF